MGGSFLAPGPPKLTFIESKRCQFLFILSMEQDGVFQKILTSPISLMNIFFGTPCRIESLNIFEAAYIEKTFLFYLNFNN